MTPDAVREETRAFWTSLFLHVAAVAGLAALSLGRSCARPPKPREIVTYIDVAASVAAQSRAPVVPDLRAPPEPPPLRPPRPQPQPTPREIPSRPAETRPRPDPQPRPQPRPTPSRPPALRTPTRPALTHDQIREHLASGLPARVPAAQDDFPFGWYFALVRKALYDAWTQPGGLSASSGLSVQVRIRVERDGTVSRREILRPSGHAGMDESVRRAMDAVRKLPPLPDGYRGAFRDITIEFELTDITM